MENIMEELMKRVDDKWGCKTDSCHRTCDSHPCLIQAGLKWRYCEDCETIFDFQKHRYEGHDGHNIRILTLEEYLEATESCKEAGCFDE